MNIEEIAEALRGTCQGFDPSDLSIEQCKELDDLVRLCDTCGWWVEAHDIIDTDGEAECTECANE